MENSKVREIQRILLELEEEGIRLLQTGMERANPYDYDNPSPWPEKNRYVIPANRIGNQLIDIKLTGPAKLYYWKLLKEIARFTEERNTPLNRGLVCGKLCETSILEGDIDGGIAYMLWATRENRGRTKDFNSDEITTWLLSKTYRRFAAGEGYNGRSPFGTPAPHIMLKAAINEYNKRTGTKFTLDQILNEASQTREYRALLEGSLWTIHRNLAILKYEQDFKIFPSRKYNLYTKLRVLDGFLNLCRFIEYAIKSREKLTVKGREPTMGELIHHITKQKHWVRSSIKGKNNRQPQNAQKFNTTLQTLLNEETNPYQNYLILLTIRNYIAHVCDPEIPIFFNNLGNLFNRLIWAYLQYLDWKI
ncbi:MAG: hypothetical protein ACFFCO_00630 [Promethearchaeota archaeon]